MAVSKYVKQPLSPSLAQYVDAELRKVEFAVSNLVDFAATVDEAAIAALQAQAYTIAVIKPSDTSTASDNTPNADPHLVLPLTAGVWEIDSEVVASCAIAGIALAYNHIFSATIQSPPISCSLGGATINALYDSVVGPGVTAFTVVLAAATRKALMFRYIVEVLTPGNLVFFWSQGTANASPVTLHKGSFLRARKLI